jgi:hypothetical protein
MAQKKEKQASTLTLAPCAPSQKWPIFGPFWLPDPGNSPGSLPAGLPSRLPYGLPESGNSAAASSLGRALDIRAVAYLIGCSPWTVRQKLIRVGLPHFRSGASGKLIFYEAQVVRWIESQQKGGLKR